MNRLIPLILAALPLLAPAAPPASQPAAPTDEVGSLIQALSSDSYQTRETATQQLVSLGDAVLPRLQKLLPLTVDGETRSRLRSAIDQILESAAAGPSLITLDLHEADPKSAFAELSRQAHAEIRVAPDILQSLPPVTFRCDHEPFWPALKRLCAPLDLAPDTLPTSGAGMFVRRSPAIAGAGDANDHTLDLVRAGDAWERTPTSFSGPFMVCVQRVTRTGIVVPATGQRVHNAMMECIALAEPKLTVVGRNPTARVTLPEPAANNPFPPGGGPFVRPPFSSHVYYNPNGASAWPLVVPVSIPPDLAGALPELKAVTSANVLVRSETWQTPDIAHVTPRSWQAAGRTFTVTSVTRRGDNIELLATATRSADPRTPGANAEDMAVFNTLELLDPQGRPLPTRMRSPRPSPDPRTLSFALMFQATPAGAPLLPADAPLRLRWRLPLETKDIDLDIHFTNLPLP